MSRALFPENGKVIGMQNRRGRTVGGDRPRILFIGKTYAGWQTRLMNLRSNLGADERFESEFVEVSGWRTNGLIEKAGFLPPRIRGRMRASLEAAPFARIPRANVIWSSATEVLFPYLWAQKGPLRRPLVLEVDWTVIQQEGMAREYFERAPRKGRSLALALGRERAVLRSASVVLAMSRWAADSVIAQGVDSDRVRVIHPGVDLRWWVPPAAKHSNGPLRLLFVGGDFIRKGGPELLAACSRLRSDFVLDVVTRQSVPTASRVNVHRLEPNAPALRKLYQQADLFVLPTRADCFGHAAVEAMACGIPVVMTDVGGARDIVVPGETGCLLQSTDQLQPVLDVLLGSPDRLREMGLAARRRAEALFDGRRNDRSLADILMALSEHRTGSAAASVGPLECFP